MSRGYNTRAYVSNAPGAFAVIAAADFTNGAQDTLPSISANSTTDYFLKVDNASSLWKVQKTVHYMHSVAATETAGIIVGGLDCIQPLYPGATAGSSAYTQVA